MNTPQLNQLIKILTLGESTVGKTSIVERYIDNTFKEQFISTLGTDYRTKFIQFNNTKIQLDIWDTAGQERFKEITIQYLKQTSGIMVIYDVTNRSSFLKVNDWFNHIKRESSKNKSIVLVGNKIDLNYREVSTEDGTELANKYNVPFIEVSAYNGTNIDQAYRALLEQCVKPNQNKTDNSCCIIY